MGGGERGGGGGGERRGGEWREEGEDIKYEKYGNSYWESECTSHEEVIWIN